MLISISDFMDTRSSINSLKKAENDQSLLVIRNQVLEMADKLD